MKLRKNLLLTFLLCISLASLSKSGADAIDEIEPNYLLDVAQIADSQSDVGHDNYPTRDRKSIGIRHARAEVPAHHVIEDVIHEEEPLEIINKREVRPDIQAAHWEYHNSKYPAAGSSNDEEPAVAPGAQAEIQRTESGKNPKQVASPQGRSAASDAETGEPEQYDDPDADKAPPQELSDEIKEEEPLSDHGNKNGDIFVPPLAHETQETGRGRPMPRPDGQRQPFALFTVANTAINIDYCNLPYREKYLWFEQNAPCHSFDLKVPDELAEKSVITLCIFRPMLEFPDETKLFILNSPEEKQFHREQKVLGHVVHIPESAVYGRIIDGYFYGEVSLPEKGKVVPTVYVVEEINLLNKLMRHNQKTLTHMLMVMKANDKERHFRKQDKQTVYNAVVTKGASLITFMVYTSHANVNRNPFIMFSTSHNSYIASGEPTVNVDEHGEVKLESGNNNIHVENDGSIKITIPDKEYIFRPNGRTIVKEGMEVRTLQEHEGSVAITAYTSSSTYDCVLPTPAFHSKRKGGYVCKVCLSMDETFRRHYLEKATRNESDLAQNYLGRIIDRVSWIFRSMDFDGDTKPDNIGLDYDSHPLQWNYPDIGGEDVNEQDIEILFQSLESYKFADCCLGIGFTMKNFPKDVLGKRTQAKSGPSGVCSGRTGRIANNLIIISANSKKGAYSTISEKQLIYATANQIGGAFGAKVDGLGNDECDEFQDEKGRVRHHLMWPDVMRNTTLEEQSLSSCSKADIIKTLSTCRSSCFDIDKHPFCGNGIVEEGEECDCGSEHSCFLQTCCYSRIGKHPCRKTGVGCASGAFSLLPTSATLFWSLGMCLISLLLQLLH